MLNKVLEFLFDVVIDGLLALFLTFVFMILFDLLFWLVMIPVGIIGGDSVAQSIDGIVQGHFVFRIAYAIIFFSLLLEDLGVPNLKALVMSRISNKRQERERPAS